MITAYDADSVRHLAAEKQEGEDAASRVCVGLFVFAASTGLLRCH